MHSERYEVGADAVAAIARTRARGGRVVAVGTTSLRALESAALARADGEALQPAQRRDRSLHHARASRFRVVDLLLTNFHLPKSTLLMLVAAFAGHERIRALYAHAIAERYRFFSYGDAMLLARDHGRAVTSPLRHRAGRRVALGLAGARRRARPRRMPTRGTCAGLPQVDAAHAAPAGASPCSPTRAPACAFRAASSRSRRAATGWSTWAAGSRAAAGCCEFALPARPAPRRRRSPSPSSPTSSTGRSASRSGPTARSRSAKPAGSRARRRRGRRAGAARAVIDGLASSGAHPLKEIVVRPNGRLFNVGSATDALPRLPPGRPARCLPRASPARRRAPRSGRRRSAGAGVRAAGDAAVRARPAQLGRARLRRRARRAAAGRELDRLPRRGAPPEELNVRARRRALRLAVLHRRAGRRARLRGPLRLQAERGAGAALAGACRAAADARRAGGREQRPSPASCSSPGTATAPAGIASSATRSTRTAGRGRAAGLGRRLDSAGRRAPARRADRHRRRCGRAPADRRGPAHDPLHPRPRDAG